MAVNVGKVLVATASAATLVFFGVGCKTEVSPERCEGKRIVADKYISAEGEPTLDIDCDKGSMYVQWDANDESDKREWDNYTVGQEYTG